MKDCVIGLVPHVLGFVINELCKNAFLLAYENDLSDLKGLVPADAIDPDDWELLESVDDEVVQIILTSVDKVVDCLKTYYLINNLDELETMENETYNELASDSHYAYIIDWESKSYRDLLINLNTVYFCITRYLYHTTIQLRLDEPDIPEELYDEFLEIYNNSFEESLRSEDKNISLLYDLILNLNEDLVKIDKFYWEGEE